MIADSGIGALGRRLASVVSVRPTMYRHLGRALAGVAFIYMLNAFVQSSYIHPWELVFGMLWVGVCFGAARWLRAWMILGVAFAGMLAWAFFVESRPISDFMSFHRLAQTIAEGGEWLRALDSKSPPTVAYFAVFQTLVSGFATNYVAGALAWTAGCWLIYRTAKAHLEHAFQARLICAGLAFYPTFVVFAGVPSSEALFFLLTAAVIAALAKAASAAGRVRLGYAALAGLLIALLYLTRMNGLVLLLPCVYILLAWRPGRDPVGTEPGPLASAAPLAPAVVIASVVVAVLAFGGLAALKGDGFRITPSQSGGLLLLFGTNEASRGGFNRLDATLAGHGAADPAVRARAPARAREIALQRIGADIPGFLAFAATVKVGQLWGRERPEIGRSIGPPERRRLVDARVLASVVNLSDGAYRMVFLLFLVALAVQLVRPDRALVLGAVVLLYALPHVFIEVQPRYHLTMAPYMIAGALLCVADVVRRAPAMRRWTGA